ncbi:hypothetical protein CBS147339_994 [Penicillium roqueforti]|nr:hypothetical protein CBS147355_6630 [Penicillium roqueforti]KAI2740953.1 hypothetical protein DTO012A1_4727 [Penicillium roqueforti]KAI2774239.1 hypothetical protein DTO012A8_1057 [Penicillium roqueforti]KAI3084744.1 hypothetical protein CBS147339_994 [Penicillium roqueforti]KAI3105560.1 hypothetical protein CBS147338_1086 [Penicillium roqueforti]
MSVGRSVVDPLRPLVSVALGPLWTIAYVQRVRESALGPNRLHAPVPLHPSYHRSSFRNSRVELSSPRGESFNTSYI